MKSESEGRKYKPAEVARILSECYAHKVTAAVIRKWDNTILSTITPEGTRAKGENRGYSQSDVDYFNLIAVLRNMGYSLDHIKEVLPTIGLIGPKYNVGIEVMNRIARQRQGFDQVEKLLSKIGDMNYGSVLAPAPEQVERFPYKPSSADYRENEFKGKFTVEGLLEALRNRGFDIPKGKGILFVNEDILWDKDLYKKYPELTFTKEEQKIIDYQGTRNVYEIDKLKIFNRSVVDRGDSHASPANRKK